MPGATFVLIVFSPQLHFHGGKLGPMDPSKKERLLRRMNSNVSQQLKQQQQQQNFDSTSYLCLRSSEGETGRPHQIPSGY